MHGVYLTMEDELDKSSVSSPAIQIFWSQHEDILNRSEKLRLDLRYRLILL
jgi:hypothetical protein